MRRLDEVERSPFVWGIHNFFKRFTIGTSGQMCFNNMIFSHDNTKNHRPFIFVPCFHYVGEKMSAARAKDERGIILQRILRYIILLVLLMVLLPFTGEAQKRTGTQTYSFEFRGESLTEALDLVTMTIEIDLVYDPQLVHGLHVYRRIQNKGLNDLLNELLNEFQLDYLTLSSGTIVIIRSVSEGPFYGTLAGKITDIQSGEPLQGATVLLADASGGTSSNRSGNFSLNRLLTGTHTVIFSYVGYEPVIKTFEIGPNEEIREQIRLQSRYVDVAPVVVEAHRSGMPAHYTQPIPSNNPEIQPASPMRDPIRSLSFVPGIQYGLPMTDLHLQGGQQTEHRILLDGIPIYNPYSFGQFFTSFSPYAIGAIELHRAGYGVNHGSQIAGIINLRHDLHRNEAKRAILQADPLSLNFRSDLNIPAGNSDIHVMTALRTNFWNTYRDPSLEQTIRDWDVLDPLITNTLGELDADASLYSPFFHDSDVRFYDIHLAFAYDPDDFSTLSGTFYHAENSIETMLLNQYQRLWELPDAPYIYSGDKHDWNNLMARLGWNRMITPRLDLSVQAAYTTNRFSHSGVTGITDSPAFFTADSRSFSETVSSGEYSSFLIPLPSQINGNRIHHGLLQGDASYSFSPGFMMEAGLQADVVQSEVDISDPTEATQDIRTRQSSVLIGSYMMSRHRFGTWWSVDWGSRLTYVSAADNVFAEPRASVQYDKTNATIGYWSLRLSGGLYRQFINEYRMTNTGATAAVPSFSLWSLADGSGIPKAWHLNGSFFIEPASNTTLNLEGYYKWQPAANIVSYVNIQNVQRSGGNSLTGNEISAFGETTQMTSLGGSIRLSQAVAGSRLKIMAGYDYSYSRIDYSTQFGRMLPAPWNEPHRLQLRALLQIYPALTVVPKWQGIWGRAWAFREAYYNYLLFQSGSGLPSFNFSSPDNDRLPAFTQFDLSVIWKPVLGPADFELRLDLINLLNRKNILDQYLLPVFDEDGNQSYESRNRTFPGFYPTVSLSVSI